MTRRLQSFAAAILAVVSLAMPARAQDPTRVQLEISRTDERIVQAQTVVTGSGNERAEFALGNAVRIQAEAKNFYASLQFAMALRATLDARMRADAAISIVRGQPDPERVSQQVERTRELIERARQRVEECPDDRARALLRSAVEMQVRAEASLKDGRFLAALRLTLSARERAWRALRLCHAGEERGEDAERALRRTDDVIERARQVVAEHALPRAEAALNQSIELQARAWGEFRANRLEASVRLTMSARTSAQRAIRLAGDRR